MLPQSGERDGRRGVERDDGRRQPDVRRMLGIVHDPGQRRGKKQGCGEKQQREQRDGAPCRLEHFLAFPLGGGLSGKAEVARLEPHGQHDQRERDQRVEVGHHAVLPGRHQAGQVGKEQVVQKPGHDRSDAVDRGLPGQLLQHTRVV